MVVKLPVSAPAGPWPCVQGLHGRLRLDARLQKLLQQTAGEGGLPPGCLSSAHAVRQRQAQEAPPPCGRRPPYPRRPSPPPWAAGPRQCGRDPPPLLWHGPPQTGSGGGQQFTELGVLAPGAAAGLLQAPPVLPPQQECRELPIDGGEKVRQVDAPVREVAGKVLGQRAPRSSRKGVASFRALKVPVYSFCQQSSHRAQPGTPFLPPGQRPPPGSPPWTPGPPLPMLSYRARRAAAIRVSWARIPSSAAGNSGVSPASPACRRRPRPGIKNRAAPTAASGSRGVERPAGRAARAAAPQNASAAQIRLPLLCGSQPEGPPDHRPPRKGRRPGRNRSPPPGPPPVRRLPRSWPPADRRCRPAAGTTVNAPRRHRPVLRPPAPAEWSLPETADYLAPAAPPPACKQGLIIPCGDAYQGRCRKAGRQVSQGDKDWST